MSISYLTPSQAAEIIGVSVGTLSNWRGLKKGPAYIKIGRVLYRQSDIDKYLESKVIEPLCRSVRGNKKAQKCA